MTSKKKDDFWMEMALYMIGIIFIVTFGSCMKYCDAKIKATAWKSVFGEVRK